MKHDPGLSDEQLDALQWQADPAADRLVAAILGPWDTSSVDSGDARSSASPNAARWARLAALNRLFAHWNDNASVAGWKPPEGTPEDIAAAVSAFLAEATRLPAWIDAQRVARSEALFMDQGVLSCVLLFCASLPECYVIPDLSLTLHATGRLEQHAEHRIRSTAAMIFPVMMEGGLTTPKGAAVAQVMKVRLIHATVRNLILRGDPESAAALARQAGAHAASLPPLPAAAGGGHHMHEVLFAHGWNLARDALPCNQEELAYTLLTFHYVFLRSMRKLGLGLPRADEEAYLHTWNVVGHLLGIREDLLVHTMPKAAALFKRLQQRGRAEPLPQDPRPALTAALVGAMEAVIPVGFLKPVPRLLTRHLCGRRTASDIGLDARVPGSARLAFWSVLALVRVVDLLMAMAFRRLRLARVLSRAFSRRLMARVLMNQTRPLQLPQQVLGQAQHLVAQWQADPTAPAWANRMEQRLAPAAPPVTSGDVVAVAVPAP